MAITNSGHIELRLSYLVDIRASQMNGCAFCLDMHVKEAKLHGERELRLYHLAICASRRCSRPRNAAALALTRPDPDRADRHLRRALCRGARAVQREGTLDAGLRVMGINAWNRANVAFRTTPGAHDKAFGLDKAGLAERASEAANASVPEIDAAATSGRNWLVQYGWISIVNPPGNAHHRSTGSIRRAA